MSCLWLWLTLMKTFLALAYAQLLVAALHIHWPNCPCNCLLAELIQNN